jgi:hypothetical protein
LIRVKKSLPSGSALFFPTGLDDDLRLPMIDCCSARWLGGGQ